MKQELKEWRDILLICAAAGIMITHLHGKFGGNSSESDVKRDTVQTAQNFENQVAKISKIQSDSLNVRTK